MNCPLHPLRALRLDDSGLNTCPVCELQFGPLDMFLVNFASLLAAELRADAVCFTRPKKCPQCDVPTMPFRIGGLEAWIERCPNCEHYLVERAALQSAQVLVKKRQRENAWKSYTPEERQQMAVDLSQQEAPFTLGVSEVNTGDVLKAVAGIPNISHINGHRLSLVTLSLVFLNVTVFTLGAIDPVNWAPSQFEYSLALGMHRNLWLSLFAHASWAHLLGNMLFLFPYGDAVERVMPHSRFALAYLGLGTMAMLVQCLWFPTVPVLGASGAIAGLMGLAAVLQWQAKLKVFLFWAIAIEVPIWLGLAFYFLLQIFLLQSGVSGIAFVAHVAGFLGGGLLGFVIRFFFR